MGLGKGKYQGQLGLSSSPQRIFETLLEFSFFLKFIYLCIHYHSFAPNNCLLEIYNFENDVIFWEFGGR